MASNSKPTTNASSDRISCLERNRRLVASAMGPKCIVVTLPFIDGEPRFTKRLSLKSRPTFTSLERIIKRQLSATPYIIDHMEKKKTLPKWKAFLEFEGNKYDLIKTDWVAGVFDRKKVEEMGGLPNVRVPHLKIVVECYLRPVKAAKAKRASRAARKNEGVQ